MLHRQRRAGRRAIRSMPRFGSIEDQEHRAGEDHRHRDHSPGPHPLTDQPPGERCGEQREGAGEDGGAMGGGCEHIAAEGEDREAGPGRECEQQRLPEADAAQSILQQPRKEDRAGHADPQRRQIERRKCELDGQSSRQVERRPDDDDRADPEDPDHAFAMLRVHPTVLLRRSLRRAYLRGP